MIIEVNLSNKNISVIKAYSSNNKKMPKDVVNGYNHSSLIHDNLE